MPLAGRFDELSAGFARLQTSAKLIVILTVALMPLGVIALLASLESVRSASGQRRAELRVAATEASRKLATELASDVFILRRAVAEIDTPAPDSEACLRADALLRARGNAPVAVAFFGPGSVPICRSTGFAVLRPAVPFDSAAPIIRRSGDAIDLIVQSPSGGTLAVSRYGMATLAAFARPTGYGLPYGMTLDIEGSALPLATSERQSFGRTETAGVPVGFGEMTLTMTVDSAPFGAAEALQTFLPLVMWAAAAIIGFLVVDRLLIRPLKVLRALVDTYEPGSSRRLLEQTPTVEIRALEASFTAFADTLAAREHDLERALDDQIRLTREVHHRVKNNLQVIASLISLHARDTASSDAEAAYGSIQRRVDALAIVHRNHFAELEASTGIEAKALLSELVANFRASTRMGSPPTITLSAAAVCVTQDTAMPLAFLFTEIAEMALLADMSQTIAVRLDHDAMASTARFEMQSRALVVADGHRPSALRIVEGLARQLRTPLDRDAAGGRYALDIPVLADRD